MLATDRRFITETVEPVVGKLQLSARDTVTFINLIQCLELGKDCQSVMVRANQSADVTRIKSLALNYALHLQDKKKMYGNNFVADILGDDDPLDYVVDALREGKQNFFYFIRSGTQHEKFKKNITTPMLALLYATRQCIEKMENPEKFNELIAAAAKLNRDYPKFLKELIIFCSQQCTLYVDKLLELDFTNTFTVLLAIDDVDYTKALAEQFKDEQLKAAFEICVTAGSTKMLEMLGKLSGDLCFEMAPRFIDVNDVLFPPLAEPAKGARNAFNAVWVTESFNGRPQVAAALRKFINEQPAVAQLLAAGLTAVGTQLDDMSYHVAMLNHLRPNLQCHLMLTIEADRIDNLHVLIDLLFERFWAQLHSIATYEKRTFVALALSATPATLNDPALLHRLQNILFTNEFDGMTAEYSKLLELKLLLSLALELAFRQRNTSAVDLLVRSHAGAENGFEYAIPNQNESFQWDTVYSRLKLVLEYKCYGERGLAGGFAKFSCIYDGSPVAQKCATYFLAALETAGESLIAYLGQVYDWNDHAMLMLVISKLLQSMDASTLYDREEFKRIVNAAVSDSRLEFVKYCIEHDCLSKARFKRLVELENYLAIVLFLQSGLYEIEDLFALLKQIDKFVSRQCRYYALDDEGDDEYKKRLLTGERVLAHLATFEDDDLKSAAAVTNYESYIRRFFANLVQSKRITQQELFCLRDILRLLKAVNSKDAHFNLFISNAITNSFATYYCIEVLCDEDQILERLVVMRSGKLRTHLVEKMRPNLYVSCLQGYANVLSARVSRTPCDAGFQAFLPIALRTQDLLRLRKLLIVGVRNDIVSKDAFHYRFEIFYLFLKSKAVGVKVGRELIQTAQGYLASSSKLWSGFTNALGMTNPRDQYFKNMHALLIDLKRQRDVHIDCANDQITIKGQEPVKINRDFYRAYGEEDFTLLFEFGNVALFQKVLATCSVPPERLDLAMEMAITKDETELVEILSKQNITVTLALKHCVSARRFAYIDILLKRVNNNVADLEEQFQEFSASSAAATEAIFKFLPYLRTPSLVIGLQQCSSLTRRSEFIREYNNRAVLAEVAMATLEAKQFDVVSTMLRIHLNCFTQAEAKQLFDKIVQMLETINGDDDDELEALYDLLEDRVDNVSNFKQG